MLILGGGNGEILPFLYEICPQLSIDYVEASSKMIHLAKRNAHANQNINFIHSDEIPENKSYSNYFFPFILDCFNQSELQNIFSMLKRQKGGHVLYIADFYKAKSIKQKLILKLSILFFQLTTKHPNSSLIDVFMFAKNSGYKELNTCHLSHKFIKASYLAPASY